MTDGSVGSAPAGPGGGDDASRAPLTDDPFAVDVVASETVFEGRVWNIRRDEFRYGDHTIVREYMDHTGAVAIVALDESDRMLLIKQYRHPVRVRDWEIPAGLLDIAEEDAVAAAQRELAEEADLVAGRWDVLGEFYTTPGGSDEAIRIFLARDLSAAPETFARSEEEADIEVRWVPLDDVVDAVLARRVQNPSLVIGALAAHASRARDWSTLAPADAPWDRRPRVVGAGVDAVGGAGDAGAAGAASAADAVGATDSAGAEDAAAAAAIGAAEV